MIKKRKKGDEAQNLLDAIVFGMQEVKANDITVLDLRALNNAFADYFVICDGSSNTQVQAIAASVEKETLKLAEKPLHIEGMGNSTWVLLDYVNVVVHVFEKQTRAYYDLEDLWADAEVSRINDLIKKVI